MTEHDWEVFREANERRHEILFSSTEDTLKDLHLKQVRRLLNKFRDEFEFVDLPNGEAGYRVPTIEEFGDYEVALNHRPEAVAGWLACCSSAPDFIPITNDEAVRIIEYLGTSAEEVRMVDYDYLRFSSEWDTQSPSPSVPWGPEADA